jgi:hypothetical protein
MGANWFRQEYMCEFVDSGTGLLDRDVVERALDDDVKPLKLSGRLRTWD